MLRELSAAVLACGLGMYILGCQDENGKSYPDNHGNSGYNSTYDYNTTTPNNTSSGNPNRETSGGTITNAGSMSKQASPSTQP